MRRWKLDPTIHSAPQPWRTGPTPAYLWEIGIAVRGDKDMAALATIWSEKLQVYGRFVSFRFRFCVNVSRSIIDISQMLAPTEKLI